MNTPSGIASCLVLDGEPFTGTRSAGEALQAAVGQLVNVLDPAAVVVGGGLGLSEGPFWNEFIAATRHQIWSDVHRDLPILRAATGTSAGLIGAAATAWDRRKSANRLPSTK